MYACIRNSVRSNVEMRRNRISECINYGGSIVAVRVL